MVVVAVLGLTKLFPAGVLANIMACRVTLPGLGLTIFSLVWLTACFAVYPAASLGFVEIKGCEGHLLGDASRRLRWPSFARRGCGLRTLCR